MMHFESSTGLWMLLVLGVLIARSGLPVWTLLIGVASAFAGLGLVTGIVDTTILKALPLRLMGVLEHDLLQALPLYVFIGVLLQRLTVADMVFSTLQRAFKRTGAGTSLAALSIGALVAPMNGSVASSSALLARLVTPRLGTMHPASATALVSIAATIGVVVPPSLVLILLGDAMMRAHTEASNLAGFVLGNQRIINTQDVFRAALLPAVGVLILWTAVAWWQGRKSIENPTKGSIQWIDVAISGIVITVICSLLGMVFLGKMFAVEAAATGGVVLLALTLSSRALDWTQWRGVLEDTLNLSGALFALLVGATTFSLIFRLFGTDRWISEIVLNSPLPPSMIVGLVLLVVALCAWVLDAFEMIFVIIPIVAPALIARLGDAQQIAVLLLLVLQLSFLIPPMGYAVLIARSRTVFSPVTTPTLLKSLFPFLLVQCAVTALVFMAPWTVHQLDGPVTVAAPMSTHQVELLFDEMRHQDEPVQMQDDRTELEKRNPLPP